jgi:glycosyltransferase involved in cell wall biosynthesis
MSEKHSPMIMMLGLRGFPGVQGGVETHAEHLCPKLVELGCRVEVIVRSTYQPRELKDQWGGIRFKRLWAPKSKGLEAIVHTFLGVLYAAIKRPDILHIQAIGPSLLVPLARALGLKVVVTHHGPDYDRQKWGYLAKCMLKFGERFGMQFANARIVISMVIQDLVRRKYGAESVLIPNGVSLPRLPRTQGALERFGLARGRYVLMVSRLVPEKRHPDLIEAFEKASLSGWRLVIVGASDHPDEYTRKILAAAGRTPDVICTGFQSGEPLRELYAHAGMFVLPSSHEGLPIALLEALSYGLPVIASDIPANLEVGLPENQYFPLGDRNILSERLREFAVATQSEASRTRLRAWVSERYDWEKIARRTREVYLGVLDQLAEASENGDPFWRNGV